MSDNLLDAQAEAYYAGREPSADLPAIEVPPPPARVGGYTVSELG